jgi:hypothetical protein
VERSEKLEWMEKGEKALEMLRFLREQISSDSTEQTGKQELLYKLAFHMHNPVNFSHSNLLLFLGN